MHPTPADIARARERLPDARAFFLHGGRNVEIALLKRPLVQALAQTPVAQYVTWLRFTARCIGTGRYVWEYAGVKGG